MGYSKEAYDRAEYIMSQRRSKAKNELAFRRSKIYKELPLAEELENKIAQLPLTAIRSVVKGSFDRELMEKNKYESLKLQEELNNLLISHGYSEADLTEQYSCCKCNDTGYVDGIMCDCMKQLLKKTVCEKLNNLSPLELCSFEEFRLDYYPESASEQGKTSPRKKMTKIFEYCKNYADNFSESQKNIIMQGNTGLGKTHLSLSIANAVIETGVGVIYASTPDIVRQIEKEYFDSNNKTDKTEQSLIDCDLLILDDLGTEYINKYSTSTLYNIINTRLIRSKPTIINTNLSVSALQQTYGMRFVSRIIGEFDRLDFDGVDIRQLRKKAKL